MKQMDKKEVSRILCEARDLMNHNGAHWGKNHLRRVLRRATKTSAAEYRWCALGGVKEVLGESQRSYKLTDQSRPVVYALAYAIRGTHPRNDNEATRIVWCFNDSRDWKSVKNLFTKVARNPVWQLPGMTTKNEGRTR